LTRPPAPGPQGGESHSTEVFPAIYSVELHCTSCLPFRSRDHFFLFNNWRRCFLFSTLSFFPASVCDKQPVERHGSAACPISSSRILSPVWALSILRVFPSFSPAQWSARFGVAAVPDPYSDAFISFFFVFPRVSVDRNPSGGLNYLLISPITGTFGSMFVHASSLHRFHSFLVLFLPISPLPFPGTLDICPRFFHVVG